jgi:hypothetical protein
LRFSLSWDKLRKFFLGLCSLFLFPHQELLISVLGKTPLSKKAHEKSLTSIEQGLMAGPNCQAGRGKDGAAQSLGEQWLL